MPEQKEEARPAEGPAEGGAGTEDPQTLEPEVAGGPAEGMPEQKEEARPAEGPAEGMPEQRTRRRWSQKPPKNPKELSKDSEELKEPLEELKEPLEKLRRRKMTLKAEYG